MLLLPHTTVPVERLFSELKDFKTHRRNRLSTENLEACLFLYQKFGEEDFVCTPEMYVKYNNIWKKPKAQTVGTIEEKKLELEGIQKNEISQKPDQEASKSIMFENLKNGSFF